MPSLLERTSKLASRQILRKLRWQTPGGSPPRDTGIYYHTHSRPCVRGSAPVACRGTKCGQPSSPGTAPPSRCPREGPSAASKDWAQRSLHDSVTCTSKTAPCSTHVGNNNNKKCGFFFLNLIVFLLTMATAIRPCLTQLSWQRVQRRGYKVIQSVSPAD